MGSLKGSVSKGEIEVIDLKHLELYIQSFDPDLDRGVKNRILNISIHPNLKGYKFVDTQGIIEEFIVSSDHSLFCYSELTGSYERVSPLEILKHGAEKFKFIRILEDGISRELIPVSRFEIIELEEPLTMYDFTVETDPLFTTRDGIVLFDSMAIYAPLSVQAQEEIEKIFDPKLQIHPGKLKVLGFDNEMATALYKLTKDSFETLPDDQPIEEYETLTDFVEEVGGAVYKLLRPVKVRIKKPYLETTSTRAYLTYLTGIEINRPLNKGYIQHLLTQLYTKYVLNSSAKEDLEKYKNIVYALFRLSNKAANELTISLFSFYDKELLARTRKIKELFKAGEISESEFEKEMEELTKEFSKKKERFKLSYYSKTKLHKNLVQMVLYRGNVIDIYGNVLGPILGSYFDGLSDEDIFLSSYGSRKGLIDKTQNVADSGYLLRKLVFASQVAPGTTVSESEVVDDCGTNGAFEVRLNKENFKDFLGKLTDSFLFRYFLAPELGLEEFTKITFSNLHLINNLISEYFSTEEDKELRIYFRSPIYCTAPGFCKKCLPVEYLKISNGHLGIVSSQAICEDLTQTLLRTFHTGGSAETSAPGKGKYFTVKEGELIYTGKNPALIISLEDQGNNIYSITLEFEDRVETDEVSGIIIDKLEELQQELPLEVSEGSSLADVELVEKTEKRRDFKQLTKVVASYFKSKENVPVEEFYQIMLPINAQSLYKEFLIQMMYYDQETGLPARLTGWNNYYKESLDTMPHKKLVTSIAFENPNKFLKKIIQEDFDSTRMLEEIREECEKSPLVALCMSDLRNLKKK